MGQGDVIDTWATAVKCAAALLCSPRACSRRLSPQHREQARGLHKNFPALYSIRSVSELLAIILVENRLDDGTGKRRDRQRSVLTPEPYIVASALKSSAFYAAVVVEVAKVVRCLMSCRSSASAVKSAVLTTPSSRSASVVSTRSRGCNRMEMVVDAFSVAVAGMVRWLLSGRIPLNVERGGVV